MIHAVVVPVRYALMLAAILLVAGCSNGGSASVTASTGPAAPSAEPTPTTPGQTPPAPAEEPAIEETPAPEVPTEPEPVADTGVILHAFNWRYAQVQANAAQIAAAGYRKVLVSPAYRSQGGTWWARYQPQDLRVIDNPLGTTDDFVAMIQALAAHGVQTYADVVLNHMANEYTLRQDLDYPGVAVLGDYAANQAWYQSLRLYGDLAQNQFGAGDFAPAHCITDYYDVYQVRNYRMSCSGSDPGLPDLIATDNVVAQQRAYLQALKGLGVTGFRVDAAKHMQPEHIARVFTDDIRVGVEVFGEVITGGGTGDAEYAAFLAPYLQETEHAAYDFPLFHLLRNALLPAGSLESLVDPVATGQALPAARAITFATNHDIPNNAPFRHLILDPVDEVLAYAYLFGRDGGTPMLYSDHDESGDARWVDAWKRTDLTAMIGFHNAMQGHGMQMLSQGACHLLFRRGNEGIVGINKCGSALDVSVSTADGGLLRGVDYVDVLDASSVVRIDGDTPSFRLPPRQARMWMR